jgi:hypothetical protein
MLLAHDAVFEPALACDNFGSCSFSGRYSIGTPVRLPAAVVCASEDAHENSPANFSSMFVS